MDEFDRERVRDIIRFAKPDYDWFTACLLRAIYRAPEEKYRYLFYDSFPEEVRLVEGLPDEWDGQPKKRTMEEWVRDVAFLFAKSHGEVREKMFYAFPRLSLYASKWTVEGVYANFNEQWRTVYGDGVITAAAEEQYRKHALRARAVEEVRSDVQQPSLGGAVRNIGG